MALVAEPLGQEEMDALVAEAGGGEDGAQAAEPRGDEPRLLAELARRACLGRLVGRGEDTRRKLPEKSPGRVAILPDQHDAPEVVGRHDRGGADVVHQLEVDHRAVRERDALDAQVDDPPPINLPAHGPDIPARSREEKRRAATCTGCRQIRPILKGPA